MHINSLVSIKEKVYLCELIGVNILPENHFFPSCDQFFSALITLLSKLDLQNTDGK